MNPQELLISSEMQPTHGYGWELPSRYQEPVWRLQILTSIGTSTEAYLSHLETKKSFYKDRSDQMELYKSAIFPS